MSFRCLVWFWSSFACVHFSSKMAFLLGVGLACFLCLFLSYFLEIFALKRPPKKNLRLRRCWLGLAGRRRSRRPGKGTRGSRRPCGAKFFFCFIFVTWPILRRFLQSWYAKCAARRDRKVPFSPGSQLWFAEKVLDQKLFGQNRQFPDIFRKISNSKKETHLAYQKMAK